MCKCGIIYAQIDAVGGLVCLDWRSQVRALESKCEFLLGERLVVMGLDRIAVAAEFLIWGYAEVPALCVLDERAWARGGVSFVGVYARHADWFEVSKVVTSIDMNAHH